MNSIKNNRTQFYSQSSLQNTFKFLFMKVSSGYAQSFNSYNSKTKNH